MTVARYRSWQTLLRFLYHPGYAPQEAYKFIATELDLVPAAADMMSSDPRVIVDGGFAFLLLLVGWQRASRHPG